MTFQGKIQGQPDSMRFDRLLGMRPIVLDAVDPAKNYRYWRAQHLGALAYNLSQGRQTINTAPSTVTHWCDSREWAQKAARIMTESGGYSDLQFPSDHQLELAKHAKVQLGNISRWKLPVVVVALDNEATIPPAAEGYPGFRRDTLVQLSELDRDSRTIVEYIFGIKVQEDSSTS